MASHTVHGKDTVVTDVDLDARWEQERPITIECDGQVIKLNVPDARAVAGAIKSCCADHVRWGTERSKT